MHTLETIKQLVADVKYKDWIFNIDIKADGFLLQVQFMGEDTDGSGKMELQKCRKWYLSSHMCDTEIIRTCFLAVKQAEEHEICERFKYKGQQIYNPHVDTDLMATFISTKPFQVRK